MDFETKTEAYSAYLSIMGTILKKYGNQYTDQKTLKELGNKFISLATAPKSSIVETITQMHQLFDYFTEKKTQN